MSEVMGDIGSAALEPFQQIVKLGSKLIDATGEGVEWTGEQVQEFADMVSRLDAKVGELQANMTGDSGGSPTRTKK